MHVNNDGSVELDGIDEIDYDLLDDHPHGTLSKSDVGLPSPSHWPGYELARDSLLGSLPAGAIKVYREDKSGKHLQVRVYDDHYKIQVDHYHPDHDNPVKHIMYDWPTEMKLGVGVVVGGGAYLLMKLSE